MTATAGGLLNCGRPSRNGSPWGNECLPSGSPWPSGSWPKLPADWKAGPGNETIQGGLGRRAEPPETDAGLPPSLFVRRAFVGKASLWTPCRLTR